MFLTLLNFMKFLIDSLFRPRECHSVECRQIQNKSLVSAWQYEKFVRVAFAIQASIEGSINTLLIERSCDAGERGTTRAVGPSHNSSSSLWASRL